MWRIYGGAIILVAGIGAFIEAHSHPPELESRCRTGGKACLLEDFINVHIGLSQTAYDLLRIGAWALMILGAVTVIVGLIRYRAGMRSAP